MYRNAYAALALMVVASTAAAYYPNLTGDDYVAYLRPANPQTPLEYRLRDKAYSYLEGVKDSTEGIAWCDVDQVKTPDLAYDIADAIAKMPKSERAGNAARLIQQHLQRLYPCSTKRRK